MTTVVSTPDAQRDSAKTPLKVLLCAPRGFCAGVDRAIQIVELALERYGAPVYVRHEIVHNKYVVESLRAKGAVFVDELNEIPETEQPVIFSAHGVPKSVTADAQARNMFALDATCPLVTKVHREANIHAKRNRHVLLIGHSGHPEVIGTIGQLPEGSVTLVETVEQAEAIEPKSDLPLAWITQTTLSVDETREIVDVLERRFPEITGPHKDDICYATTNRQEAVKQVAPQVDAMLVVGAPNSSNSQRLREAALRAGAPHAQLVQRAMDIDWTALDGVSRVGITAGASAPEVLVDEVIDALGERFAMSVETVTTTDETVTFTLPRELRTTAAE